MNIPSNDGQIVAATDLHATQSAITQAILDAGVASPPLLGVQVDKLPGANPAGNAAPDGQAYCWVILADNAETFDVVTVQNVLNGYAPAAKAPSKSSKAKKPAAKNSKSAKRAK
ncbi:MAG: hypothetical protein E6Q97_03215 [Desulfurellales bacterium]|nr:MAG: hypothetical protein E6Q97_03215 [Desulfurellales bacterium]